MEGHHGPPLQLFKGRRATVISGPTQVSSSEEQRAAQSCRQGTLHPLCPQRTPVTTEARGSLIFLSSCEWRHRTLKPRGRWWISRTGVPKLTKGILKPRSPLNLTWHRALVAQPRHLRWPDQHSPCPGHHRDHVYAISSCGSWSH